MLMSPWDGKYLIKKIQTNFKNWILILGWLKETIKVTQKW